MSTTTLQIVIKNKRALLKSGVKKIEFNLDEKPLLWGIAKMLRRLRDLQGLSVDMEETSFSGTREAVAVVNTIAWALKIKVNGQAQLRPTYQREPNITKPKHDTTH
ncbi:MAG: hypothetical protein UX17_C0014G0003 [Parcubacteria group bacterium GW2011_GWC2_45_7]|nr:MAG: hypothetical protein UX17_C0014G0003 [Parcubacteria group bacterium GW2011_GWC2_45_7]KKU74039.1 MAG: hypothetical protein UX98_C0002G0069 [Parcubacteria group bacterium GW2011_GWA2_47_26]